MAVSGPITLGRRLLGALVPESLFPDSADELRRARLAAVTISITAGAAFLLTAVQIAFGAWVIAWATLVGGLLALALLPLLRVTRSVWLAANGVTTILAVAFTAVALLRGGFGKTVVMAYALVPMLAVVVGGRRTGNFWVAAVFVILTAIAIIQRWFGPLPEAPLADPLATNYPGHLVFVAATYFLMSVYARLKLRAEEDRRAAAVQLEEAERRRAESETEVQLLRSSRMAELGTLAAGVAHEINNPLTYVVSNVEYLRENDAELDPAQRAEILDEVEEGSKRIARIVRNIGTFSRLEPETEARPVDLHRVLESSVNLLDNQIRHRAELHREEGPVPRVLASPTRLAQVFVNVISNAVQALPTDRPERGHITITTRTNDAGNAVVAIRDDGVGIPPEVKSRILEPFFTTKPVGVGTGLGLSICYGIVTKLGGALEIESEPGRGTTVSIELPAADPDAEIWPPEEAAAPPAPTAARVLVIDDDASVAGIIRRLLRKHRVEIARSGREGIATLTADSNFDVILCDVMMPDLSGPEVYAAIQDQSAELARRVVFMTGGAFTAETQRFLDATDLPCLEKPFTHADLEAVIARARRGPASPPSAEPGA